MIRAISGEEDVGLAARRDVVTKQSLSPARRRLLQLMQRTHFGRIRGLKVKGGEPDFSRPIELTRTVKMAGQNGAHPAVGLKDFVLKQEVRELFAHFDRIGDGVVEKIEIKHGLPFSLEVSETVAS